jgi:hypothetical protein
VIFRLSLILFAVLLNAFAHASGCRDSVVLLGNESGGDSDKASVKRDALLKQMASLYSAALQDRAILSAFAMRLQELASIEGVSPLALYREIEPLAVSPVAQKDFQGERAETRQQEQVKLIIGLEPYLQRIGRKHREIIERTLIFPGRVNPLTTGEVEFRFQGKHRFVVGDEGFEGKNRGAIKEALFGPHDSFAIGQVPVTQLMYFLVALASGEKDVRLTPSYFKDGTDVVVLRLGDDEYRMQPNHPVEGVSIDDANAHIDRIAEITGVRYELPSELQWEFANRAGSKDQFHFGSDENLMPRYGWFELNSGEHTHAVGQLLPNAFNLYDTHGNVWEWTAPFIIRGGSWFSNGRDLGSAHRCTCNLDEADNLGFRLVRQLPGLVPPSRAFTLGETEPKVNQGSSNALRSSFQNALNRWSKPRKLEE